MPQITRPISVPPSPNQMFDMPMDPLSNRMTSPPNSFPIGFKDDLPKTNYSPYPPQVIMEEPESKLNQTEAIQAVETLNQPPVGKQSPTSDTEMTTIDLSQSPTDGKTPTLKPHPNFDPSNDAKVLYEALKSFISNKNILISILCNRTEAQRMEIKKTFKQCYGVDLVTRIRAKTSGKLKHLLEALLTPLLDFYCKELFDATVDDDTDEEVYIETIFMTSNETITEIQELFEKLYFKSLVNHIKGSFARFLTKICGATRDESGVVDRDAAEFDARHLLEAGIGQFQDDQSVFEELFTQRNLKQLKLVCEEYQKLAVKSLEEIVERQFDDEVGDSLISFVQAVNGPTEFIARRLYMSCHGLGTNDRQLNRLIILHCEEDLADIKGAFETIYQKSLKDFLKVRYPIYCWHSFLISNL